MDIPVSFSWMLLRLGINDEETIIYLLKYLVESIAGDFIKIIFATSDSLKDLSTNGFWKSALRWDAHHRSLNKV